MSSSEQDYWEDLTVQLRLAGLKGAQIGAVLEEAKDHLAASGEHPKDAFGPSAEFASELAESHRSRLPRAFDLSRGDLLAAAAQLVAWWMLASGIFSLVPGDAVEVRPGVVTGWVVLTVGFAWPVWPATRAFVARRTGFIVPLAAMMLVVASSVVLSVVWRDPVLALLPALPMILVAVLIIAGCWWRAWRRRDPIRRPIADGHP